MGLLNNYTDVPQSIAYSRAQADWRRAGRTRFGLELPGSLHDRNGAAEQAGAWGGRRIKLDAVVRGDAARALY